MDDLFWRQFRAEVVGAIREHDGTVDARVIGESVSAWGTEDAMWLSVTFPNPLRRRMALYSVRLIAGKYGQEAVAFMQGEVSIAPAEVPATVG